MVEEKAQTPQSLVEAQAREVNSRKVAAGESGDTVFPFEHALKAPGMSFICELKQASPSKGIIAQDYPYLDIARDYEKAGAAAISCLTEPTRFKGSDEHLRQVAALFGMECVVYMGQVDMERQALNVYRMRLLGAEVRGVTSGTGTLKDAVSETFREWTRRISDTHYCLGSCMGPHPFPTMVRDFQSVISKEAREQILEDEGKLPAAVIACVGGGSNAIGSFYNFIGDKDVRLIGCEAAGRGIDTRETAATMNTGSLGIFHGMKSYFCQNEYGQIAPVYTISAGLDYPGVGPEHAALKDSGRAQYVAITDGEAVDAFEYLSRTEGIIPAIESAHAAAYAMKLAPTLSRDQSIIVTLSGRGDKDVASIARYRGEDLHD